MPEVWEPSTGKENFSLWKVSPAAKIKVSNSSIKVFCRISSCGRLDVRIKYLEEPDVISSISPRTCNCMPSLHQGGYSLSKPWHVFTSQWFLFLSCKNRMNTNLLAVCINLLIFLLMKHVWNFNNKTSVLMNSWTPQMGSLNRSLKCENTLIALKKN